MLVHDTCSSTVVRDTTSTLLQQTSSSLPTTSPRCRLLRLRLRMKPRFHGWTKKSSRDKSCECLSTTSINGGSLCRSGSLDGTHCGGFMSKKSSLQEEGWVPDGNLHRGISQDSKQRTDCLLSGCSSLMESLILC
ncbi:unnamed protein product [Menidia menidia]|uniref:(Atlantic silverside) hypothetical protein n=1 Tax=Menidia menidia TaxID=238744 RepID=A0A8S4BJA7_9TELE|nr:unnamed protein product [Menidia menidia]